MTSKQITIRVTGDTVSLEPVERYLNHLYRIINKQKSLFGNMQTNVEPSKSFSVVIDARGHLWLHNLEDHISSLVGIIRENFTCIKMREDFSCLKSFVDEQEKVESDWSSPVLLSDVYEVATSRASSELQLIEVIIHCLFGCCSELPRPRL